MGREAVEGSGGEGGRVGSEKEYTRIIENYMHTMRRNGFFSVFYTLEWNYFNGKSRREKREKKRKKHK